MSGLREYLIDKKIAVTAARERVAQGAASPKTVQAKVRAEGRSGVRRVQIRGHQFLTDSGPEMGGFDLGPSPVEALLGALGGCLAHTIIIQAAARNIPLDALEVTVSATADPRAGHPKHPDVPVHPQDITYLVEITSPESPERIEHLVEVSEQVCPITSLLVNPQRVTGSVVVQPSADAAPVTASAATNGRAG
ncbi:MAG: OsmC family protein [Thermomicrobiales bacterium]